MRKETNENLCCKVDDLCGLGEVACGAGEAQSVMRVDATSKSALCARKRRLLDYFEERGLHYTVATIDREPVVYRKLKDYDIEISGGSYRRPFFVYVWALQNGSRPVCTVAAYTVQSGDIPAAAKEIDGFVEEYKEAPAFLPRCRAKMESDQG